MTQPSTPSAPQRTCLGCGQKRSKRTLTRLCLGVDGQLGLDRAQVAPGRGGYVCGQGCFQAAVRRKAWARAFKGQQVKNDVSALGLSI